MYKFLTLILVGVSATVLSCASWAPSTMEDTPVRISVPDLETQAPQSTITDTASITPAAREASSLSAAPVLVAGDLYQPESQPEYNMGCADFSKLMSSVQPSTVEELLTGIQLKQPKFLTRAVWAYETTMPFDDATMVFPRTVVYGGDAHLILNFGGRSRQRSYERLEAVCFDDAENKFNYFDVVFPKEAHSAEAISDLTEAERTMKSVMIAGGRGQRTCTNCHGESARPNWDSSPFWPGFYGAIDDSVKDPTRSDSRPTYQTFEYNFWKEFQAVPATRKRYALISQELARPNADFTLKLSYLNGRRIVQDLAHLGKEFEPHKYEFARALFCAPQAPRRTFTQLNGESSESMTLGVLPESTDAETKDIFLWSYYDQMQREKRLGEVLAKVGIPNPLPKEHFEELRAYYRNLFPDKDLNLDMRLSTVDVDEVLLMRELKRVTDKIGIDIESWSMVRDGGYSHENGLGGPGRPALRLILERPFVSTFLKDDTKLAAAISVREDLENAKPVPADPAALTAANAQICALINKH
jgi:hypothetical protein